MALAFLIPAIVAVLATARVVTCTRAVHALLYLIVSLLAVAIVFYVLGAPFAAALEALIYAGAIMVLFVFVVMMLNLGEEAAQRERQWLAAGTWIGPAILAAILLAQLLVMLWRGAVSGAVAAVVGPREVGALLFGPYLLAVELASMLLLAGLVAAYHLGRQEEPTMPP
jgi:NADH-quinone oxidoreductase subunit J